MWIAKDWKDYEVIDTSGGEKLERWGEYTLVRPDPQVIWNTPKKHKGWKKMNGHYHRSNRGGGEWEFFDLPDTWQIHYKNLTFRLQPFKFKHTGLFPEQAVNCFKCVNVLCFPCTLGLLRTCIRIYCRYKGFNFSKRYDTAFLLYLYHALPFLKFNGCFKSKG